MTDVNSPVVIGIMVAFVVVNIVVIRLGHRKQGDMEEYTVGSRQMPWYLVCFGYMGGWYVGAMYTGFAGNSASLGLFAQYLIVYSMTSLIVFLLLARPMWIWGKAYNLESQAEYIGKRYDSLNLTRFWAVFQLIVSGCWLVIELVTIGYIINLATNGKVSLVVGILAAGIFCAVYTTVGGVRATAVSSVVQGITFVAVGTVVFALLIYKSYGGLVPLFEMIEAHKPALFTLAEEGGVKMLWTTSIITGTIGAFCWPNIFLRLFMASSPREAKKSLFVAPICALVVVFFILAPTMGGTLLEGFPEDAQIGLFWMANKYGGPVMLAFVALFAASASLTTISTDSNALAIPLAKYVLQPLFKKTPIVRLSMITTAVICAVAMWIATMDVPQLNFFAIMLYNFIGQISIPIILGAYWKKTNKTGVILGLIVGCGFAFVNQFWASAFDWTGGWGGVTVGLILNLVIVVIVGFARGKQPHVDEMFEQFKLYDNAGRYWGKKDDAAAE